jgi:hypothetical protein
MLTSRIDKTEQFESVDDLGYHSMEHEPKWKEESGTNEIGIYLALATVPNSRDAERRDQMMAETLNLVEEMHENDCLVRRHSQ